MSVLKNVVYYCINYVFFRSSFLLNYIVFFVICQIQLLFIRYYLIHYKNIIMVTGSRYPHSNTDTSVI